MSSRGPFGKPAAIDAVWVFVLLVLAVALLAIIVPVTALVPAVVLVAVIAAFLVLVGVAVPIVRAGQVWQTMIYPTFKFNFML